MFMNQLLHEHRTALLRNRLLCVNSIRVNPKVWMFDVL
jgi:hypothetical protein